MEHTRRQIYLPLENLDNCSYCEVPIAKSQNEKPHICSACGERVYCASECQRKDWITHKTDCGTTNRIQLSSFYPFLAYLIKLGHFEAPLPSALTHEIVDIPNPDNVDNIASLPNGRRAKVIWLGKPIPHSSTMTKDWWPTASSKYELETLFCRIHGEGKLLPLLLATCVSLASEMYSTTAVPKSEEPFLQYTQRRRVRLTYQSAPIADFGIVKGSTGVAPINQLVYFNLEKPSESFITGQDPDDHYWIYFTTATGEEIFLDCGLLAFNNELMVDTFPCSILQPEFMPICGAPALFYDRAFKQDMDYQWNQTKHVERQRFSVLRAPEVCEALSYHDPGLQMPRLEALNAFMDKIAGRSRTHAEEDIFRRCLVNSSQIIRLHLHHQTFLRFPANPAKGIALDPDCDVESLKLSAESLDNLSDRMKKHNKRLKQGKISHEQWQKVFMKLRSETLRDGKM